MQANPSRTKLNVLFIGGSNTVLKNGYFDETVRGLGEYFELGQVDNVAVGATSIGMGLWMAMGLPSSRVYDLIFIEYCVNDYALAKKPERFANWRWAYDALLTQLRRHNPKVRIYNLMFGRRSKRACPIQQALFQGVLEISARHGVQPVAVDDYLHGLLAEGKSNQKLFDNESHYARPVVTAIIGNYVARVVMTTYDQLQISHSSLSPPPVEYRDYRFFSSLGEVSNFTNSRYAVDAIGLEADGPWREMQIPGSLLQLNLISTRNSGRILVAEEGEETIAFDTMHSTTSIGAFPFLIRNVLFSWKKAEHGSFKPRTVALRAISGKTAMEEDVNYMKLFGMRPPREPKAPAQNNVVYLAGALFS